MIAKKPAKMVNFTCNLIFLIKMTRKYFFQQNLNVKVHLMMKTKTIAKVKCFGSPARQRDALVTLFFYPFFTFRNKRESFTGSKDELLKSHGFIHIYQLERGELKRITNKNPTTAKKAQLQ